MHQMYTRKPHRNCSLIPAEQDVTETRKWSHVPSEPYHTTSSEANMTTAPQSSHGRKPPMRKYSEPPRKISIDTRASEYVKLNLCGQSFQVFRSTLLRFPATRLGQIAAAATTADNRALALCDCFIVDSEEFFFQRSPRMFDSIINLYRYGQVHFPDRACSVGFYEEIQYWEIDEACVAQCCREQLHAAKEHIRRTTAKPSVDGNLVDDKAAMNNTSTEEMRTVSGRFNVSATARTGFNKECRLGCGKWSLLVSRRRVWDLMELPNTSKYAMAFTGISLAFVFATATILIIGSMPEFNTEHPQHYLNNGTYVVYTFVSDHLETADTICVIWFSLEIAFRMWAAPDRCGYLRSFMCLIDLGSVLPFYFELVMSHIGVENKFVGDFRKSMLMIRVLRALRIMRVFRILKVARYSKGFQSVGCTLKKSWKELCMLILFMFTTNIIFSTIMYFLEEDQANTKFISIPASAWWCIITMTTVGYGDIYPHTVGGKFLAGFVSITGIILLAFPISVIVEHFHDEYNENDEANCPPTVNSDAQICNAPQPKHSSETVGETEIDQDKLDSPKGPHEDAKKKRMRRGRLM